MAVRIGFVGAGGAARRHARLLAERDDVVLAAFCDLSLERAASLARVYGATAFDSSRAMLAESSLDALWVCVPPGARGPAEALAIERGCALFLETPVAATTRAASVLAARCKRAGVPVCVCSPWRHSLAFERARRLLATRGDGLISHGLWRAPQGEGAWRANAKMSGGWWLESAWPLLDVARLLGGEPRRLIARSPRTAVAEQEKAEPASWRGGALLLEHQGGALSSLMAQPSEEGPPFLRLEFAAEKVSGTLVGSPDGLLSLEWHEGGSIRVWRDAEAALSLQHAAFLRALTQGKRLEVRATLPDSLATLRLGSAAQRAQRTVAPLRL